MADFPVTGTRVGVSYRSAIEHELEGNVSFTNVPTALAAGFPNGDIRADIELPATLSVAVAQEVTPKLQLLADFTWTEWSSIPTLDIFRASGAGLTSTPLRFDDSWRVGLGANYQVTPAWKLRGGVAYDLTPVQDEDRTPRLPDEDRFWLAGGVQWKVVENLAFDAGFAWLFVKEASSELPAVVAPPSAAFRPSPRGNLVGDYEADVWIASAQARYSF
jgi:long-chain fatty acid transport protein